MKKELKDYIGYYIDQLVTTISERYQTANPCTLLGVDFGLFQQSCICHVKDQKNKITYYISQHEIKIVLRPLTDLSEEEEQEIRDQCFRPPALEKTGMIEQMADFIDVLRGRGYDVYGLIAAGVAVSNTHEPLKTTPDENL